MVLLALLAILLGSYAILSVADRAWAKGRLPAELRGRVSLSLLFLFTGMGHFVRSEPMAQMLPDWMPARFAFIYITGVLEWAGAVGLLTRGLARPAGVCLIAFLVLALPANVYAAVHRVQMGGHQAGPAYLLLRVPFQLLLIWWTYRFAVRRRTLPGA